MNAIKTSDPGSEEQRSHEENGLGRQKQAGAHLEAFLARYGESLRRYAQDTSIGIEVIEKGRRGKDHPESWAIDLEKGTIYADPQWFEDRGYNLAESNFAVRHEVEHFRELRDLLSESDGYRIWKQHRSRVKADRGLFVLDDVLDNIRVDRAVRERTPTLQETGVALRRKLEKTDLTQYPKHLQFALAIEHEALTGDRCGVSDEVRREIDVLEQMQSWGKSVIDVLGDPALPSSKRLDLQRRWFEPVYQKLRKQDREEAEREQKGSQGNEGEQGQSTTESDVPGKKKKKKSWWPFGKKGKNSKKKSPSSKSPPTNEDLFGDTYDEIFAESPRPVSREDIDKAVEAHAKKHGLQKSPEERAEEAYAKEYGVAVDDLRRYRQFFEKTVAPLRNPETNETVLEELRDIFRRIISERTKHVRMPRVPTTEGEVLINPAQAYADIKAGRQESESWMTFKTKERPGEKMGAFDIILVCDGSGSMNRSDKKKAQHISAVLLTEALKEFADELEDVRDILDPDLRIRSELRIFGEGQHGHDVLKVLNAELTEKHRCHLAGILEQQFQGGTPDYLSLEDILNVTSEEEWQQVKEAKLRKIVIVLTDGDSDNPSRMQQAKTALRDKGAIVVVLGMAHAGATVDKNVETVEQLAVVLGELLQDCLKDA